ncbi:MAG: MerR family transcriptional regulator [Candidatus Methanomethyliaceae archaeon]
MTVFGVYQAGEVCRATGLTHRQLDYWDCTGLFRPSTARPKGRGNVRLYSYLDVVELRVMKQLLDAGLSTRRLRGCLAYLKEHLRVDKLSGLSLVAAGNELYLLTDDPTTAIDLAKKGQVAWIVDVENAAAEVKKILPVESLQ